MKHEEAFEILKIDQINSSLSDVNRNATAFPYATNTLKYCENPGFYHLSDKEILDSYQLKSPEFKNIYYPKFHIYYEQRIKNVNNAMMRVIAFIPTWTALQATIMTQFESKTIYNIQFLIIYLSIIGLSAFIISNIQKEKHSDILQLFAKARKNKDIVHQYQK